MSLERRLRGIVAAELMAGGLGLASLGILTPRYIQPPSAFARAPSPRSSHTASSASGAEPAVSAVRARSVPVAIAIPALGITSVLGPPRGLNPDGTINDAPLSGPAWSLPWWYQGGPSPGQAGSAVLLGHVDSADGAGHLGAFFRLGDLPPGGTIEVQLADGVLTRWSTVSTVLYRDGQFPDTEIYRTRGSPTLRLVTCGGPFNWHTHHYESTVVVTAVEAA